MTKAKDIETRWWGWGDINKTYPVEERPTYIPFLEDKLGIKVDKVRIPDPKLDELELREPRLGGEKVAALEAIVPEQVAIALAHGVVDAVAPRRNTQSAGRRRLSRERGRDRGRAQAR
jgi:hypothetical protein